MCPRFLQSGAAAGQYLIYSYIRWEFAARFCCSKPLVPAASHPAEIRWQVSAQAGGANRSPGWEAWAAGGRGAGKSGHSGALPRNPAQSGVPPTARGPSLFCLLGSH